MELRGQIHAPGHFTAGNILWYPLHVYEAGWGLGAGLDVLEKREISCLYQESNPDSSVVQPVA
jgi:hypothetical protein